MDTAFCRGRTTRSLSLAAGGVLALSLAGCIPGNAANQPPVTKASVSVSHTIPAAGTAPCTGTASWRLTPVPPFTGTDGDTDPKDWTSQFSVNSSIDTKFGDRGWSCTVTDLPAFQLRPGKWRFETKIGPYSGACTFNLHAGPNGLGYHQVTQCPPS